MALRVNENDFDHKVLKADKPVFVEFYSDSCIPCKKMASILGDLEDEFEDNIYIRKVNVNFDENLVEKYEVMSSPTIILFHNGLEVVRLTGAVKKEKLVESFADLI